MDVFFQLANGLPGVKGEVVEKGRIYYLTFLECTCHLCKKGYVTTPMLCECSRQSVLYSLQSLWKGRDFQVKLCHSILQGEPDCKMRIEVIPTTVSLIRNDIQMLVSMTTRFGSLFPFFIMFLSYGFYFAGDVVHAQFIGTDRFQQTVESANEQ